MATIHSLIKIVTSYEHMTWTCSTIVSQNSVLWCSMSSVLVQHHLLINMVTCEEEPCRLSLKNLLFMCSNYLPLILRLLIGMASCTTSCLHRMAAFLSLLKAWVDICEHVSTSVEQAPTTFSTIIAQDQCVPGSGPWHLMIYEHARWNGSSPYT